jgi:hypothetical protein
MTSITASRLDKQIKDAQVSVAKSAIAHPAVYPQYCRMMTAKAKLEAAQLEFEASKKSWERLIEAAPSAWKKLAPRV